MSSKESGFLAMFPRLTWYLAMFVLLGLTVRLTHFPVAGLRRLDFFVPLALNLLLELIVMMVSSERDRLTPISLFKDVGLCLLAATVLSWKAWGDHILVVSGLCLVIQVAATWHTCELGLRPLSSWFRSRLVMGCSLAALAVLSAPLLSHAVITLGGRLAAVAATMAGSYFCFTIMDCGRDRRVASFTAMGLLLSQALLLNQLDSPVVWLVFALTISAYSMRSWTRTHPALAGVNLLAP
ncbi:hypothetical protein JW905_18825, partial [bacterium]|nr:hypothetical protein [candidate division CSSED10-310 bacterium]